MTKNRHFSFTTTQHVATIIRTSTKEAIGQEYVFSEVSPFNDDREAPFIL